ncbi:MAG TPA: hypothetical protein VFA33_24360 [Bryobacteraceae bacterium]|nr:hypothetical protein [Bryobacteraceae bacterium]
MRRAPLFFALLFAALLAARLCHTRILWAEENLPLAAAAQMLRGKVLYRDLWFDKPPLLPGFYLLWGARIGGLLRAAGALYALAACGVAWRFAGSLWGEREAFWAAGLLAFFLTFDFPSGVMPLAADLLMLLPHLAAVYFASRRQAFLSGVCAGIAFLVNPKGVFVAAVCALWTLPALVPLALGFVLPNAAAAGWLWSQGALLPYYEQVWKWGRLYAGGTFLAHPVRDGALRTAHWLGFHAAAVLPAAWFFWKDRAAGRWKWAAWAAFSFAGVMLGWRFFPRYFFQLLPVVVLAAARGLALLPRKPVFALTALLLIPFVRFGPRYGLLAWQTLSGQPFTWVDVAMDQDSRAAAKLALGASRPGDTLFVWGFRPELYVYTGLPAATRFLDSQPLTGVPADRHLTQSKPVEREQARAHRRELAQSKPALVLDGLGPYNPNLALATYPDLQPWLQSYREIARTSQTIVYRRVSAPGMPPETGQQP